MENQKSVTKNDVAYLFRLIGTVEKTGIYPLSERGKMILQMAWVDRMTYEDIGSKLNLTRERIRQIYDKEKNKLARFITKAFNEYKDYQQLKEENAKLEKEIFSYKKRFSFLSDDEKNIFTRLELPVKTSMILIKDLDLTKRTNNVLEFLKVKTIQDLIQYNVNDLLTVKNCGVRTIRDIEYALKEHGIEIERNKFVFVPNYI